MCTLLTILPAYYLPACYTNLLATATCLLTTPTHYTPVIREEMMCNGDTCNFGSLLDDEGHLGSNWVRRGNRSKCSLVRGEGRPARQQLGRYTVVWRRSKCS